MQAPHPAQTRPRRGVAAAVTTAGAPLHGISPVENFVNCLPNTGQIGLNKWPEMRVFRWTASLAGVSPASRGPRSLNASRTMKALWARSTCPWRAKWLLTVLVPSSLPARPRNTEWQGVLACRQSTFARLKEREKWLEPDGERATLASMAAFGYQVFLSLAPTVRPANAVPGAIYSRCEFSRRP